MTDLFDDFAPPPSPEELFAAEEAQEEAAAEAAARRAREMEAALEQIRVAPGLARNFTCWREIPARPAQYAPWPEALEPRLIQALAARGIERPYTHQAEAIRHALEGRNVCVVTPTASGKTLCYNAPTLDAILRDPRSRALYLFPTKALSHDQYRELYGLTQSLGQPIRVYTFDGDTPAAARKSLRTAGQIVVTNPDMLHTGVLPHHTLWMKLFENLRYVVVDELHQYRGVFGSHVANVLRRLRRVCAFYGARPRFIACSATIANPRELAENLIEEEFALVEKSGAPQGRRVVAFYNPPVVNEELGIRLSVKMEARRLATRFLARGLQVIVFTRSRLMVEVISTYLRRAMEKLHLPPTAIAGYRSGYLPAERRGIEEGLKSGEILGVVSTNALELGIDIGSLDVAILAGWPGTVASAWQQGGRAGRKAGASAMFLVAESSPLDQFLMNHPEFFFGAPPEQGIINPDNLSILTSHVKCACFEIPFSENETFGNAQVRPLLERLDEAQVVRLSGGRFHYSEDSYPAEDISLRSARAENFIVLNTADRNSVIAEMDYDSVPYFLHPDAIYIHQGRQYVVDRLDWDGRAAYVRPVSVDYYTDAEASTNIQVLAVDQRLDCAARKRPDGAPPPLESKNFGAVSVVTVIAKFKKVKFETHESIGYGQVHVPQNEIQTEAWWLTLREELRDRYDREGLDLAAGLRGLAHLLRHTIPLFVLCDPRDFSVWPMIRAPHDQRPTLYVYDRYPGGIGIARRLFSLDRQALQAAAEIVGRCACPAGCPACVGPRLEAGEEAKATTRRLLEEIRAEL